jgi:hypothetical protein
VHVVSVDPFSVEFDSRIASRPFYPTQPNHGINIQDGTVWATNLLFGAPLEVDLVSWQPRRILRYVEPTSAAPQISSTSHFAWTFDRRYAYFHQSLLERESPTSPVKAADLRLIRIDTSTGRERRWQLLPPPDDDHPEGANFHSAFYFEESGSRFVGLLRTGAILETLAAPASPESTLYRPRRLPRSG